MINNTHVSQYIPPGEVWGVGGVWSEAAGSVAGTIVRRKAAAAETTVVTIPIPILSNSVALQGAKLASIEVDYETSASALTSITAVVRKVTRGADTAVAVVSAPAFTQFPTAVNAATLAKHKLVATLTVPAWVGNNEYYTLELTCVCAIGSVLEVLGAVVNYTFRM